MYLGAKTYDFLHAYVLDFSRYASVKCLFINSIKSVHINHCIIKY